VQTEKDGKQVIEIRMRAKSHIEMKAEWQKVFFHIYLKSFAIFKLFLKDGKSLKGTDRVKITSKPDDQAKEGTQYLLEIVGKPFSFLLLYKHLFLFLFVYLLIFNGLNLCSRISR
jgi:hypothetical protein